MVSMASTQEGENFAVGEAIENLIEKLNGTPRSQDSTESIRALLNEAVVAGGSNLRENMALYFVTKRGLEFGMQRDVIDEIIADAAVALQNGVDQSVGVSSTPASAAYNKFNLSTVGDQDAKMQSGGAVGAATGSGALLPPPRQLKPGAIGNGGRRVKAVPAPPSSRAGSLQ